MINWEGVQALSPVQLTFAQYDALVRAYGEPPRAYHSLSHVCSVIDQWRDVDQRLGWGQRAETFLALLYHDAIYVGGRSDNEERSAVFAREQAGDLREIDVYEVERLILLTAQHGKLTPNIVDRDAGLFLDCDMSILGANPEAFATYEAGIRNEYSHVPDPLFRIGRKQFIQRLLAQERIFLSDDFHTRLDRQARINLCAALAKTTA